MLCVNYKYTHMHTHIYIHIYIHTCIHVMGWKRDLREKRVELGKKGKKDYIMPKRSFSRLLGR